MMQTIFLFILLGLSAFVTAADLSGISLELKPKHCFPGDIVKLHAHMKRADFAEFTLTVPTHPSLLYVAQEHQPVTYKDGFYSQTSTWILQPTEAGEFKLEGIKLALSQEQVTTEHLLPAPFVSVESHTVAEDSLTPEPLDPNIENVFRIPLWLLLLLLTIGLLLLLLILFFLNRSKPHRLEVEDPAELSLETICHALESDRLDTSDIETLLADEKVNLSQTVRQALERRVYSSSSDDTELLKIVRREINP